MDHSLSAYLHRQPIEKLFIILRQYLQLPYSNHCEGIICIVLAALQEQEIDLSGSITPEIIACWEAHKRNSKT